MKKQKAEEVPVAAIPEVVEFVDARSALEDFKEEHAEVFETLRSLSERYNAALEQADKVCRARQVSCGPFDLYQFTTKYDPQALYNAVGRDKFLELGGAIATETIYKVDKAKLEASVVQKKVAQEVLDDVKTVTPAFHKPPAAVIP